MGIYVLQVQTGQEEYVKDLLESSVLADHPLAAERVFIPQKALNHRNNAEERRKTGERVSRWEMVLFPGYVFFESNDIDAFFEALHRFCSTVFVRLIGRDGDTVQEVTPQEMAHIRRLSGEDPSTGFIEGGRIRITGGSLQGLESFVKKVDRRKGNVLLEMEMFNRKVSVWVACDIAEPVKSEDEGEKKNETP